MVLTINSRGYLCPNHPPVIISTDLIFLFLFSSLQGGAGKTWLQDGDVVAADKPFQYTTTFDKDIYIWILLVGRRPPEKIWGSWFVSSFFCKKYVSKVFGENIFFWVSLLTNYTLRVQTIAFRGNTFTVVCAQQLQIFVIKPRETGLLFFSNHRNIAENEQAMVVSEYILIGFIPPIHAA